MRLVLRGQRLSSSSRLKRVVGLLRGCVPASSLSEVDVQLWEAVISNNLAGATAILPGAGTGVDVDARDYDGW